MNQKGIMKELSWIVGIVYLFFAGFYFFEVKFLNFIPFESHIFIALLSFIGAIYALAKWIDELTEYSLWGPFAIFGTLDIILAIVLVIQALLNIGAKYVDLETLLKESDIISIHVPLTKETELMIGEKELKMMKPGAYLINTARGRVIDEKALYKALKEKWIAGAALDVFWQEPLPKNNPLLELDNIVVAPHIGSATIETRSKMAEIVAENLIAFYEGKVPPNLVNKDVIKIREPGFS